MSSLKEKEWSQGFRITQIMTLNTILQSPVSSDLRKVLEITNGGLQQK